MSQEIEQEITMPDQVLNLIKYDDIATTDGEENTSVQDYYYYMSKHYTCYGEKNYTKQELESAKSGFEFNASCCQERINEKLEQVKELVQEIVQEQFDLGYWNQLTLYCEQDIDEGNCYKDDQEQEQAVQKEKELA